MAEIVAGLFGLSPEQFQQQRQDRFDQRAIAEMQLSPIQRASLGIQRGAYGLAGAIGGALGGTDPELQRNTVLQQIASELNPQDPESYMAVDRKLADLGGAEPQRAYLQDMFRKMQESGALVNQREASARQSDAAARRERVAAAPTTTDLTNARAVAALAGSEGSPEYAQAFRAEYNRLTTKPTKAEEKKISSFGQELVDAGLEPGTEPFQRRMDEYLKDKQKGASKGTGNVSVSLGGISLDTGAAAKAAGKVVGENVANIENQYSLQTGIKDALDILKDGIYGGAFGPEKGFIAKFTGIGDPKKVQNTEVFLSNIGEIVIPRLVQFGGNDSNEELKYLQKVVAGDQRLEPESMKRILASAEKKIQNNLARLQKQAGGGPLPTGPMTPAPATPSPRATKRYNPQTGKLEPVGGN